MSDTVLFLWRAGWQVSTRFSQTLSVPGYFVRLRFSDLPLLVLCYLFMFLCMCVLQLGEHDTYVRSSVVHFIAIRESAYARSILPIVSIL